jgi:transposase
MGKYKDEEKLEVVMKVIEKGFGYKAAGKLIGACGGDVQKWVRMYEEHGVEGLVMKKGKYTGEFKASVVEYMNENQLSIREAAVRFGIPSYSTVGKWVRKYYEEGREALFRDNRGRQDMDGKSSSEKVKLDKKTEEDLITENQRLRMENAYLKKLQALVQERVRRESGKR